MLRSDLLQGLEGGLEFVAEHPGAYQIVNLGESRTVELREMIQVISEEMGIEPRILQLPDQPGDVVQTYADISKARRLLSYDQRTDFGEGIRAFLDWFGDTAIHTEDLS